MNRTLKARWRSKIITIYDSGNWEAFLGLYYFPKDVDSKSFIVIDKIKQTIEKFPHYGYAEAVRELSPEIREMNRKCDERLKRYKSNKTHRYVIIDVYLYSNRFCFDDPEFFSKEYNAMLFKYALKELEEFGVTVSKGTKDVWERDKSEIEKEI